MNERIIYRLIKNKSMELTYEQLGCYVQGLIDFQAELDETVEDDNIQLTVLPRNYE